MLCYLQAKHLNGCKTTLNTFTDRDNPGNLSEGTISPLFRQFHSLNQKLLLNLGWLKYFKILTLLIGQLLKTCCSKTNCFGGRQAMFTRPDSLEAGDERWAQPRSLRATTQLPPGVGARGQRPTCPNVCPNALGTDTYPIPFTKPAGKGRKGLQLKGISFIKIKGKILKQSYVLLHLQT